MSFEQPNNKLGLERFGTYNDSIKFYIGFRS